MTHRIVVGISGASGAAFGLRVLERLAGRVDVETHLIISGTGERTLAHECGPTALESAHTLAYMVHPVAEVGAKIASGSFRTSGMIVAPCSMRTLGAIAGSLSDNLLIRAADVHLKERRRLVLLTRETPLHLGHLRSMIAVTEMGAIVAPPVPALYRRPKTIAEIVDHTASRAIELLGLDLGPVEDGWSGLKAATRPA